MKKSLVNLAIAAVATAGIVSTANACTRILFDTNHGIVNTRSFDWSTELDNVANFRPVGFKNASKPLDNYKNVLQWEAKYRSISFVETIMLAGATGHGINEHGMSADLLYQGWSEDALELHQDNGVPAVHIADSPSYLLENYKNAKEVYDAYQNGEWQVGWNQLTNGHKHPFHVSVSDPSGDVFQLELLKDGTAKAWFGNIKTEEGKLLRVHGNDPLVDEARRILETYGDLNNPKIAKGLPASPSPIGRFVRSQWLAEVTNFDNLNYNESMGKARNAFTMAAVNAMDAPDEDTPLGQESRYGTWVQFTTNLDSKEILVDMHKYGYQMSFNFDDTSEFKTAMCADMVEQSPNFRTPQWTECSDPVEYKHGK
ncbi:linear amide C-N hydrolase [Vibrio sinaloensis]|uniref:linear amide C-N hydrolase n=1 Tax=Photobacterium sp. (strain ATCC 43367) TaxID=379097 RepID=UPI002052B16A|nr:linear amide C-N hydrolase [Vibrio sinaloensis]UPQ89746.1 linear amide C-N hydrolase [Vibrio sinaloensis]